jgi:hypothetical protein
MDALFGPYKSSNQPPFDHHPAHLLQQQKFFKKLKKPSPIATRNFSNNAENILTFAAFICNSLLFG